MVMAGLLSHSKMRPMVGHRGNRANVTLRRSGLPRPDLAMRLASGRKDKGEPELDGAHVAMATTVGKGRGAVVTLAKCGGEVVVVNAKHNGLEDLLNFSAGPNLRVQEHVSWFDPTTNKKDNSKN
uniref:Uncharacterized protein n=1 Tax=Oryza glumipatula TaxID=40148 RepID=A0A0D9ZK83_9ORYZ